MTDNKYFASEDSKTLVQHLQDKIDGYDQYLQNPGLLHRFRKTYRAYYGFSTVGNYHATSEVARAGEQGELSLIKVNDFRNLIQHVLNNVTQQKPAFQPKSTNSDYKSQVQTILADGLLEYYMREKKLESKLKQACEYALLFGEGFITCTWNPTGGKEYGVNPETGAVVYEGDIQYRVYSPLEIKRDVTKHTNPEDAQWVIVTEFKNKYDLMTKYPEFERELEIIETKKDYKTNFDLTINNKIESDDIPVFHFYHKKTDALPDGRLVIFCNQDTVLFDGPIPYRELPVYRITPGDLYGTIFGYTPAFDLLGIQEISDALYSAITTNQTTFGVQNVMVPRGADLTYTGLAGGLNVIEYDPSFGEPKTLNLTSTPPELFNFIQMLDKKNETLSGINSVVRGNPEASLKSGAALALVASQAIQFASALQNSYAKLAEDVGTATVMLLRDFATVPRVAMIVGKHNRPFVKEFTGDDLSEINRVTVDMGNPLSRTLAGRTQIADQLLNAGLIKQPEQYIQLISTGKIEPMIEGEQALLLNIRSENEDLSEGKEVITIATDNHPLHIAEHASILSNPETRKNPQIVQIVLNHIQEHKELWITTDPVILAANGVPPPPMQPTQQNQAAPGIGEQSPIQPMPEPSAAMPSMPTNPITGEQYNPEIGA